MDPLSIVASIIPIAGACAATAKALYSLCERWQRSSLKLTTLVAEFTLINTFLGGLETDLKHHTANGTSLDEQLLKAIDGALRCAYMIQSTITTEMGEVPNINRAGGPLTAGEKIPFLFRESSLDELVSQARSLSTSMSNILGRIQGKALGAKIDNVMDVLKELCDRSGVAYQRTHPASHVPLSHIDARSMILPDAALRRDSASTVPYTPDWMADFLANLQYRVNAYVDHGEAGVRVCPLAEASGNGNLELVRMLVDSGAQLSPEDPDCWWPLHAAIQGKNPDVVSYLISRGASWSSESPVPFEGMCIEGCYPFHVAIMTRQPFDGDMTKEVGIDRRTKGGLTGFTFAAIADDTPVLKLLRQMGVSPSFEDIDFIRSQSTPTADHFFETVATPEVKLRMCIEMGSVDQLRKEVASSQDILACRVGGQPALIALILQEGLLDSSRAALAEYMVQQRPECLYETAVVDRITFKPLQLAAYAGVLASLVDLFVDRGVDLDDFDDLDEANPFTPLLCSLLGIKKSGPGALEAARILLRRGAEATVPIPPHAPIRWKLQPEELVSIRKTTPGRARTSDTREREHILHVAIAQGEREFCEMFLRQRGADCLRAKRFGISRSPALITAVRNGRHDVAALLIGTPGIDVNAVVAAGSGDTALLLACRRRDARMVSILASSPAVNVNVLGADQETPLAIACRQKDAATVSALLGNSAIDVNLVGSSRGAAAAAAAAAATDKDAKPGARCMSPFETAVQGADEKTVSLLLGRGDLALAQDFWRSCLRAFLADRDMLACFVDNPKYPLEIVHGEHLLVSSIEALGLLFRGKQKKKPNAAFELVLEYSATTRTTEARLVSEVLAAAARHLPPGLLGDVMKIHKPEVADRGRVREAMVLAALRRDDADQVAVLRMLVEPKVDADMAISAATLEETEEWAAAGMAEKRAGRPAAAAGTERPAWRLLSVATMLRRRRAAVWLVDSGVDIGKTEQELARSSLAPPAIFRAWEELRATCDRARKPPPRSELLRSLPGYRRYHYMRVT
ncbi:hypothetical protein MKZ38_002268 [Zalerion maritima]|uniref:Ankyrin repeat protein n=1 Tax=Zalerion maritima TaxID=339359 RepID=A0AAD5WRD3_9PEZI|nr:hypothetical protein MKZ38_002268 [Zalerion maritima]